MYIRQLNIHNFRGFSNIALLPKQHVILMGEPGSGRSDIIDAISMVLDTNVIRTRTTTELDFHQKNVAEPIRIEITIGGLGTELEQHFIDILEVWDSETNQIIEESETPENIQGENQEWIVRVAYQGQWIAEQERSEEWVYYPKYSDPTSKSFRRISLADIDRLGYTLLRYDSGKILDLGARGTFRRLVEKSSGGDFTSAITQYVQEVADAATRFTSSSQVTSALSEVATSLYEILRIQPGVISQRVEFSPEGGSPSGLLRSLGPTIDLGGGGALPVWRQGSTISSLFRLAESLALTSSPNNIIAIDDLGNEMDPASATHFSAIIRNIAGQSWITTRLPSIAEIFEPAEVIRLSKSLDGTRVVNQGSAPTSKAEAIAAKHWNRNLLPVFSYHSIIVVEGPHDLAALHALAIRLCNEGDYCLPAAYNIAIISAGATGSGGYSSVLRLAAAAKGMGFCSVGVVDGDTAAEAKAFVTSHANDAHAIIRLPDTIAIEQAIVNGIPSDSIRQAIIDVAEALQLPVIHNLNDLDPDELKTYATEFIKRNALHAAYVEALPFENIPVLAKTVLENAVRAAQEQITGVIQL